MGELADQTATCWLYPSVKEEIPLQFARKAPQLCLLLLLPGSQNSVVKVTEDPVMSCDCASHGFHKQQPPSSRSCKDEWTVSLLEQVRQVHTRGLYNRESPLAPIHLGP